MPVHRYYETPTEVAVIIDAMVMPPVIMPSFKSRQRKGLS